MKHHNVAFTLLLIGLFASPLLAQDNNQSLGDLARQQRKQKQSATAQPGEEAAAADAEIAGLKEASFKANILIVDSHAAIEKWVLMPQAGRADAGRARQLVRGKKFYMPFVVTAYPWPASDKMDLTARVRLVAPNGKIQFSAARFSGALAPDPRSPSVIVLNPVMDITFDADDIPGTYTIATTVTDHVHSVYARAEEQFQLVQDAGSPGKAVLKPVTKPR